MRAIGYVRVSTENQVGEDAFGLETQREAIAKYCLGNGLDLIEIYEDPAVSGSIEPLSWPGMADVLGTLRTGDIERLVVYKLDRLARDLYLTLWLEKEVRKFGAEVVSVTEPYRWDDPTQKLLLNIIMSFSEFEKSLIASRLSGGRKTKARGGQHAGGRAPIGYSADKALILDPIKALAVKRVFELRETGLSLQGVADQMNAEGYTTKAGRRFKKMQVKRILDRESLYRGQYRYAGIESQGRHEAIL
jgi:DNA invertase Pin-like site-specific DNA recombinase